MIVSMLHNRSVTNGQPADNDTSYLTAPPQGCGEVPPLARPQLLRLSSLAPKDFERLCHRLVRLDASVEECRLYGVHGQNQKGIDLYARRVDGTYRVIQCKRSSDGFTPGEITSAVDTFLKGDWATTADEFVLAVTANLESTQITDRIKIEKEKLAKRKIALTIWDEVELSALLKGHPVLVDDFFGREAVRVFQGEQAAEVLGNRLDANDMVKYRSSLGRLYDEVFRGLERGVHGDDRLVPLDVRFVMPDVVASDSTRFISPPPSPIVPRAVTDDPLTSNRPGWYLGPEVTATLRDQPAVGPTVSGMPGTPFGSRVSSTDWLDVGDRNLIVGAPGSGKSALLRILTLDVLSDAPQFTGSLTRFHGALPVWLPFAFWTRISKARGQAVSVLEAVRLWLETYDHGNLWPLIEKALGDHRLLLVVDGLDEWADPEVARACVHRLEVFASTKHVSVLASSRPFSAAELPVDPARWRMASLAPLDTQQRETFIRRWLAPLLANPTAVQSQATRWAAEIASTAHLRELSDLPLFLSLLLRSREQQSEFPEDLYAVLDEAITRLIGEHRKRKIDISGTGATFPSSGDIRKISAAAAHQMHLASTVSISDDDLRDSFRTTLASSIGYPSADAHTRATELVGSLSPGVGIMIRPAPDQAQFFHKSVLEFLAAERILTHGDGEHADLLRERLTDRRWTQVLRFLVRGLVRPREVSALFEELDRASATRPRLREATDLLAAEVAVSGAAVEGATRRRLLDRVVEEITYGERDAHRGRLIDRLVAGLSRPEVRLDLLGRFESWMRATTSETWCAVLRAASTWDADSTLLELVWHALLADDEQVQRTAGRVLGTKFAGDVEVSARLVALLGRARLPSRRAAAIEALSLGWPTHPGLAEAVTAGRRHYDLGLRHASIAADLRRSNATQDNRAALIALIDEAPTHQAWASGLLDLLIQHYPDDQVVFDYYLARADASLNDPRGHNKPATALLLHGYSGRPETRAHLVKYLQSDREHAPANVRWLTDRLPWQEVARAYGGDQVVVNLVEALARKVISSPLSHPSLYHYSLVTRTPWMRDQLIVQLNEGDRWGLGWTVRALAEGWPQDPVVTSALASLYVGTVPEGAVPHLPMVIDDPDRALTLLHKISPTTRNQSYVLSALHELLSKGASHDDPRAIAIVDRALATDMTSRWQSPENELIAWFGDREPVRQLALRRLHDRDAPLEQITYGLRADPQARAAVQKRFMTLSAPLRGRLVEGLAHSAPGDDDATGLLARYDAEPEPTVKLLAATAYARRLLAKGADLAGLLDALTAQAHTGGSDMGARRAAAFCALAELSRLDLLTDLREQYGQKDLATIQHDHLTDNSLFFRYVCRHWNDIKAALGADFHLRFEGSEQEFWLNVLAVAPAYPAVHDDLAAALAQRPDLEATSEGISYLLRVRSDRDVLWKRIVSLLEQQRSDSYADIRPLWVALHLLVDQFADDPRTHEWLLGRVAEIDRSAVTRDGRTWWLAPFGVVAALARLQPAHPLTLRLLRDMGRVEGENWRTFSEWAELAASTATDVAGFVQVAMEIVDTVRRNDLFAEYAYQPLTARLRNDPSLAVDLASQVPALSGDAVGVITRCLALSGQIAASLAEYLAAHADFTNSSFVTLDPFTMRSTDFQLMALGVLDSAELVAE